MNSRREVIRSQSSPVGCSGSARLSLKSSKYHQPQLVDAFILNLQKALAKSLGKSHRPQSVDCSYLIYRQTPTVFTAADTGLRVKAVYERIHQLRLMGFLIDCLVLLSL
jgi:hypothetical protein